ncbi:MAG TPA: anti-sigma factor [Thermoanaerobaculia bacterium]|jgi:hypothetical protein
MTVATHPGASLETLSRRHDGELSPAEREAFEAHLRGCAECREATAAFERSLAAFRTAPEAPVPPDLSARILRKIRAQTPSRRPFGVMFGIDIRWAGVFLAALLVAIVAPLLLQRRDLSRPASTSAPLTAYVVDAEAEKAKETRDARQSELQAGAKSPRAPQAPEPKTRARADEADEVAGSAERGLVGGKLEQPAASGSAPPASAPAPQEAAAGAPASPAQKPQASEGARNAVAMAAPRRSSAAAAATPDRSGGEADSFAREEAQTSEVPVRIEVQPLDSEGAAPSVVQSPPADRLSPLRGREFVVVVGADGLVRSIEPPALPNGNERSKLLKDVASATKATEAPPGADADKKSEAVNAETPLRGLRFQASGKARRVLVRIR